MSNKYSSPQHAQQRLPRVASLGVLVVLAMVGLLDRAGVGAPPTRQDEVATRGAQVMPFDLEQTLHVFQPLADGGLQAVTVKDPANSAQIALIQAHLQEEVAKFRRGDFSDPATIHGEDMPGLAALRAGAQYIEMQYTPSPMARRFGTRRRTPRSSWPCISGLRRNWRIMDTTRWATSRWRG